MKFFRFIESLEKVIGDRKLQNSTNLMKLNQNLIGIQFLIELNDPISKHLYTQANNQIEKWTATFHILFIKVPLTLAFIPLIILSYYLYFMTDFGSDAFLLPSYLK